MDDLTRLNIVGRYVKLITPSQVQALAAVLLHAGSASSGGMIYDVAERSNRELPLYAWLSELRELEMEVNGSQTEQEDVYWYTDINRLYVTETGVAVLAGVLARENLARGSNSEGELAS